MVNQGLKFEYRIQRLLFHEGYFSRAGVELKSNFAQDRVDVTDMDVLAVSFASPVKISSVIADCKSGDAKMPERVLWLTGLCKIMSVDQGIFAKAKMPSKVKEFAQSAGLLPLDDARVIERERELKINNERWLGSHNPERIESLKKIVNQELGNDERFRRYVKFLRSEFWYDNNYIRLKKICTGIQQLSRAWVEHKSSNRVDAYRWFLGESLILLSISLLTIQRDTYGLTEAELEMELPRRLTSGIGNAHDTQRIASLVNDYVRSVVTDTGGADALLRLPGFALEPPQYASGILDLVLRMRAQGTVCGELARYLDLLIYEGSLWSGNVDASICADFGITRLDILSKQVLNLLNFAERYLRVAPKQIELTLPRILIDYTLRNDNNGKDSTYIPVIKESGSLISERNRENNSVTKPNETRQQSSVYVSPALTNVIKLASDIDNTSTKQQNQQVQTELFVPPITMRETSTEIDQISPLNSEEQNLISSRTFVDSDSRKINKNDDPRVEPSQNIDSKLDDVAEDDTKRTTN